MAGMLWDILMQGEVVVSYARQLEWWDKSVKKTQLGYATYCKSFIKLYQRSFEERDS